MTTTIDTESTGYDVGQTTAPPKLPRVWTVFTAVVLGLIGATVFQVIAVGALVAWEAAHGGDAQRLAGEITNRMATPAMFILMAACAQLSFAICTLVPAWLSSVPITERLGVFPVRISRNVYPLAMMGSLVPLAIGFGLAHSLSWILPVDESVAQLFESMTLAASVPFILFISVVPPIVEELLYRGYVQRRLLERWSPAWAIGITSTMFALMHIMPMAIVALLPLSVWLGVVAWRSGSVLPAMLCHAFVNGGVNIWRMVVKIGELSETSQVIVTTAILVLSTVCFLKLLRIFRAQADRPAEAQPIPAIVEASLAQP